MAHRYDEFRKNFRGNSTSSVSRQSDGRLLCAVPKALSLLGDVRSVVQLSEGALKIHHERKGGDVHEVTAFGTNQRLGMTFVPPNDRLLIVLRRERAGLFPAMEERRKPSAKSSMMIICGPARGALCGVLEPGADEARSGVAWYLSLPLDGAARAGIRTDFICGGWFEMDLERELYEEMVQDLDGELPMGQIRRSLDGWIGLGGQVKEPCRYAQILDRVPSALDRVSNATRNSVDDIAHEVGTSSRTFHRATVSLFGLGAGQYLKYVRLSRARTMLHSSDASLRDVALRAGFRRLRSFERHYCKLFGEGLTSEDCDGSESSNVARSRPRQALEFSEEQDDGVAFLVLDAASRVRAASRSALEVCGCSREEVVGRHVSEILSSMKPATARSFAGDEPARAREPIPVCEACAIPVSTSFGKGRMVILQKPSREHREIERAKLLAKEVGHSFNNILMLVLLHAERLQSGGLSLDKQRQYVSAILAATERGRRETLYLTDFVRKTTRQPGLLDVRTAVEASLPSLSLILGDKNEVHVECSQTFRIFADPLQFELALVRLATAFRDGTASTQSLFIEITQVVVAEERLVQVALSEKLTERRASLYQPYHVDLTAQGSSRLALLSAAQMIHENDGHLLVSSPEYGPVAFLMRFGSVELAEARPRSAQQTTWGTMS